MCLVGTLLRSVLLVVILGNSPCKMSCNYKGILDSYQAIILVELQNLRLTGSETFNNSDPCPSGKAGRLLGSIYAFIQRTRCQMRGRNGTELEKPLKSMELLIVVNCNKDSPGGRISCSSVQRLRGKKRKRSRLIKVIKALVVCWQKLQNIITIVNTTTFS